MPSTGPATADQGEPQLKVEAAFAKSQLESRIAAGLELSSERRAISDINALQARKQEMYTWTEYNQSLLRRLFAGSIDAEYRPAIHFGGAGNPAVMLREFEEDLAHYIRQLESIANRIPLWDVATASPERSAPLAGLRRSTLAADGSIFIVHGRDTAHKVEVARTLERATDRNVVILHEQANRGRTLLEKFEYHAEQAAFAVVLLTADDEGQAKGVAPLNLRGRQNVIFELGFFFAALGRENVMVLMDPGVEQPSDVNGLVYEVLDNAGAWKHRLAQELEAASIAVNRAAIP